MSKLRKAAVIAHKLVKEAKLVSKGLDAAGFAAAAGMARMAGYGKKKKRAAPKRRRVRR